MIFSFLYRRLLLVGFIAILTGCGTLNHAANSEGLVEISTDPEHPATCKITSDAINKVFETPFNAQINAELGQALVTRCQPKGYDALSVSATPRITQSRQPSSLEYVVIPPSAVVDGLFAIAGTQWNHGYRDLEVPLINGNQQTILVDAYARVKSITNFLGTGYSNVRKLGTACIIRTKSDEFKLDTLPQRVTINRFDTPTDITCCLSSGKCATEKIHSYSRRPLYFDNGNQIGPYYEGDILISIISE